MFGSLTGAVVGLSRVTVGRSVAVDAGYDRRFGDATYSYAAVLEFKDRAGLLSYLRHPVHAELGALFWRVCERTTIVEVEGIVLTDEPGDEVSGEDRLIRLLDGR